MEQRERAVRLWFDMWLKKEDLGVLDLFAKDAVYIESWGPEYHGAQKIKLWFDEWNTRGTVLQLSLIRWDPAGRICFLQEFGCNESRYDPYQDGPVPKFREGSAAWF